MHWFMNSLYFTSVQHNKNVLSQFAYTNNLTQSSIETDLSYEYSRHMTANAFHNITTYMAHKTVNTFHNTQASWRFCDTNKISHLKQRMSPSVLLIWEIHYLRLI